MFCSSLCRSIAYKTTVTRSLCYHIPRLKIVFSCSDVSRGNKILSHTCRQKFLSQKCRLYCNKVLETDQVTNTTEVSNSRNEKEDHAEELSEIFEDPSCLEETWFDNIDYEAITENDPEKMKKLKVIVAELYISYEEGKPIPSKLTTKNFQDLLNAPSRNKRNDYITYLHTTEKKKESDKAKKLKKREERLAYLKEKAESTVEIPFTQNYSLTGNSIFLRIYDSSMDKYNNFSLFQASMFAPKLIIDCGYDQYMSRVDSKLLAKQLMAAFAANRQHCCPAHLLFCNYEKEGLSAKAFSTVIPTMYDSDFPLHTCSESYLDLFPKEKLVYLTPHCKTPLRKIRGDDFYIIGAMVDKSNPQPISLAKAKEEGLRMAHFPFDDFLDWGLGKKNMTVNQSIMIMVEMLWKRDWMHAFQQWVPKRKLVQADDPLYSMKVQKRLERNSMYANYRNKGYQFKNNSYKSSYVNKPKLFNQFNELIREDEPKKSDVFTGRLPPRQRSWK